MELSQDIQKQIQELQILEQNIQGFLMQKQNIQMELNESDNALGELKDAGACGGGSIAEDIIAGTNTVADAEAQKIDANP